jgi:hypothetical protein
MIMYLQKPMNYWGFNIGLVEKKYNAKYMDDFCIKTKTGWSEVPAAIFWQEKPPVEGYSNYFGLFVQMGKVLITSGESAFDVPIDGLVADNGEVIYSRYRHDYQHSKDGSVTIDGGRDYLRSGGNMQAKRVNIINDGGELRIELI